MRQQLTLALALSFSLVVFAVVIHPGHAAPLIWEADVGDELTSLTGTDDMSQSVPLDFDFPYFGTYYREIFVSTNGLVGLGPNMELPSDISAAGFIQAPCPIIAPFWSDMDLTSKGKVFLNQLDGRVVITWDRIGSFANPQASFTFQVQLMADGRIIFGYNGIPGTVHELGDDLVVGLSLGQTSFDFHIYLLADGGVVFEYKGIRYAVRDFQEALLLAQSLGSGALGAMSNNYTDDDSYRSGANICKLTPVGTIYEVFEARDKPFDLDHGNLIFMPLAVSFPWDRVNSSPMANAGADRVGVEGSPVTFDAGDSGDPDGDALQYRWDLDNDGTWDTGWSDVPTVSHTWPDDWSGTARVEVSDRQSTATDTVAVTVKNVAPTVNIGPDRSIREGDSLISSGRFSDPGADTWTAKVNYGDGSGSRPLPLNPDRSLNLNHMYEDDGVYIVAVVVRDEDGGVGGDTARVIVNNVAPAVYAGPDVIIDEGETFTSSCPFNDPGDDSWTATVNYGDGSGDQTLSVDSNESFGLSHAYADEGDYTVVVTLDDGDGGMGSDTVRVTVNNVAPVIYAGPDVSVNEGEPVSLESVTFGDSGWLDTHIVTVDWGDGLSETCAIYEADGSGTVSGGHTYSKAGVYAVSVVVSDGDGGEGIDTFTVTVCSAVPAVMEITGLSEPFVVNTPISAGATFIQPGPLGTRTAEWDWGDGSTSPGAFQEADGFVLGSHAYTTAGMYTVILAVTDDDGRSGQSSYQYAVVYDPDAGYVTGAGWIDSPEGAYRMDPSLACKASFEFVSRYESGAAIPTGEAEFDVHMADLNFQSTAYQWLVVSGAHAKLRGSGAINGAGSYGFMLSVIDGEKAEDGGDDRFRIRIWDSETEEMVYDNQVGDADDADPVNEIESGSIVIHTDDEENPSAAPSLLPESIRLLSSFPNPANPEVWIPYQLDSPSHVIVRIYSITGRLVRTMSLGNKPAGFYTEKHKAAYWDGRNEAQEPVSSGVYFYTIQAGDFVASRKMVVAQ